MNALGLSPQQVEARRSYVQAGDAARIMAGGYNQLWKEKMGLAEPENLDDVLAVQMGSFTEPFNLAWYERQTGRKVEYYSDNAAARAAWFHLTGELQPMAELVVSKRRPWMACNLDAISTTSAGRRCVLDAKHVGRLDEATILRYTPGMTHQAIVCETDWWALSVFVGNSKWELVEQECDPFYVEELIEKEREFWGFVERQEEPRDRTEPALPPKPEQRLRNIDLSAEMGTPEWAALVEKYNWAPEAVTAIGDFTTTDAAAKRHAISRETLKGLVPEDVGELRRGAFMLTRNKAGALTMKLDKADG